MTRITVIFIISITSLVSLILIVSQIVKVLMLDRRLTWRGFFSVLVAELVFASMAALPILFDPGVSRTKFRILFACVAVLAAFLSFKFTNLIFAYPALTRRRIEPHLGGLTLPQVKRRVMRLIKVCITLPIATLVMYSLFNEVTPNHELSLNISILFGAAMTFLLWKKGTR